MAESSVSRETPPPPPKGAAVLFGDRLGLAERYAGLLADAGVVRGLMGPREVPRLWERHLLNCAVIAEGFDHGESVCDVGSGAGLPGVALSIARPDLSITLLEPLLRRSTFLSEVVAELGLSGVEVIRGRAEERTDLAFDAVTARALAPLDRLVRWCLPLARAGGRVVALKGASAAVELQEHEEVLHRLGAVSWRVREFERGGVSSTVIEVVAGDTEERASRRSQRRGGVARPRQRRN